MPGWLWTNPGGPSGAAIAIVAGIAAAGRMVASAATLTAVPAASATAVPARKPRRVVSIGVFVGWRAKHAVSPGHWICVLCGWVAGAEDPPSPRLASMVPRLMAKTSVAPKKRRGPAPTGQGVQVGERWHPSELAAIDAWIAASANKTLTRAHAIRRLVALGLQAKAKG